MNTDCVEKKECRCCGRTNLYKFMDLGSQPLANSYTEHPTKLPAYPLAVNVCTYCWHTQLTHVVNPDALFRDYLYVSGTSKTLNKYFQTFANWVTQNQHGEGTVLDIACNDGSQLDAFKEIGWKTYGVDPAKNLVPVAQEKGHTVVCDYWGPDALRQLPETVDVIIAQNVFAHTDDILGFLRNCKEIMHDKSTLYIQTSQANMYVNGEFDTIYHEHLSFFNTNSLLTVVSRAGMRLVGVKKQNIHGTSYVFVIKKVRDGASFTECSLQYEEEKAAGLFKLETYHDFAFRAHIITKNLSEAVDRFKSMGVRVVGYGAAAKGMTVLNFGKISLDYIIDDNPLKQNRFTPGMQIPIRSKEFLLAEELPVAIVPLAWNFFDEIKSNVEQLNLRTPPKFIKYFPSLEIL